MLGSVAIQRINDGLGFRQTGNSLEATILLRLNEAQRNLQRGKTLPRFLLQEDQPLILASGASTTALPTGFLREDPDNLIHYFASGSDYPTYLASKRTYIDTILANLSEDADPEAPTVYIIRKTVIDFIATADQNYALTWNYYKAADPVAVDAENAWLADDAGAEWLIGAAGLRIARDTRDASAIAVFTEIRQEGRAACFADGLAAEDAGGVYVMGAEN